MNDTDRKEALKVFFELYDESSFDIAWQASPKSRDDDSGETFERYFDFLQAVYMLKSEFSYLSESEVSVYIERLTNLAKEFNYPLRQLEVFSV